MAEAGAEPLAPASGSSERTPPQEPTATATPTASATFEKVQSLFLEAAKSDQAMASTFSKLLATVEELRTQNAFIIANLRALILRLSDADIIKLTASELESFGVSKKAAMVRAGR